MRKTTSRKQFRPKSDYTSVRRGPPGVIECSRSGIRSIARNCHPERSNRSAISGSVAKSKDPYTAESHSGLSREFSPHIKIIDFSTAKSRIRVTNNLYSKFQKEQNCAIVNQHGQIAAGHQGFELCRDLQRKPLFRNILPINHLDPILCEANQRQAQTKLLLFNILREEIQKHDALSRGFQYPSLSSRTLPRNIRNRKKKYPSARIIPTIHHENPTVRP